MVPNTNIFKFCVDQCLYAYIHKCIYTFVYIYMHIDMYAHTSLAIYAFEYGVASIGRLLKVIGLFCRISSLL